MLFRSPGLKLGFVTGIGAGVGSGVGICICLGLGLGLGQDLGLRHPRTANHKVEAP